MNAKLLALGILFIFLSLLTPSEAVICSKRKKSTPIIQATASTPSHANTAAGSDI